MSTLGIFPEARRAPLAARQHLDAFVALEREACAAWSDAGRHGRDAWRAYGRLRRVGLRHRNNAAVLMLAEGLRAVGGNHG